MNRISNEVLTRILNHVNDSDIPRFNVVSRRFRKLISMNTGLQYKSSLAFSCNINGDSKSQIWPVEDRLSLLKMAEESWSKLAVGTETPLEDLWLDVYELMDGIVASGRNKPNTTCRGSPCIRGLKFIRLPSIMRTIPEGLDAGISPFRIPGSSWEHEDLGVDDGIKDFSFHDSEDILVLVSKPIPTSPGSREYNSKIYFRSLETGRAHAAASKAVIEFTVTLTNVRNCAFFIRISGDTLAILVHPEFDPTWENTEDKLYLWNWKKGVLLCTLGPPRSKIRIESQLFLSTTHFMVSRFDPTWKTNYIPRLEVYSFDPNESPDLPVLLRTYELPQFCKKAGTTSMQLYSNPSITTWPVTNPPIAPFYIHPDARLIVLSLTMYDVDRKNRYGNLFFRQSTLMHELVSTDELESVRWEDWGPNLTRFEVSKTKLNDPDWMAYEYGYRYVKMKLGNVHVYDFNPSVVSDQGDEDDDSDVEGGPWRTQTFNQSNPNKISATEKSTRGLFKRDVNTSLPYREVRTMKKYQFKAVMMDEGSLIGIKQYVSTDESYQFRKKKKGKDQPKTPEDAVILSVGLS
ncbi:hypothetical protein M422DRAFT_66750 [Sphaerobolus stellatus SS14]|nr:hypothetical protein M422DRAFT_66750 [Sphaerobolus stellatus SS14]